MNSLTMMNSVSGLMDGGVLVDDDELSVEGKMSARMDRAVLVDDDELSVEGGDISMNIEYRLKFWGALNQAIVALEPE